MAGSSYLQNETMTLSVFVWDVTYLRTFYHLLRKLRKIETSFVLENVLKLSGRFHLKVGRSRLIFIISLSVTHM